MLKKILIYGAIAGLIAGGTLSAILVAHEGQQPLPYGMAIGYLTMLVGLSLVFVAIKRHRDEALGGVIRFWPALGLGLGISVVAGILYALCWEVALMVMQGDFISDYARAELAAEKARGASAAELAKMAADMEAMRVAYANPLFRLPMTFAEIFPVGVLVSLVSAGLLSNRRFLPARA